MNPQEHVLFNIKDPQRFKVYFVELDDDNRERVISAVVERASLDLEEDYSQVHSDEICAPVATYRNSIRANLDLRLVEQDGILFKHEVWDSEEEE